MIRENSIDSLEGSCSIQLSYGRFPMQNVECKMQNVEGKTGVPVPAGASSK